MKKLILILIIMFSSVSIANMTSISNEVRTNIEESKVNFAKFERLAEIKTLESSDLTIQNFVRYLELIGVENQDIVLRQAILESGWFRSGLAKRYNNLFGMKYANLRPTTAVGKGYGHARYLHWTDSVKDYVLWRKYWESKGRDTSNYYAFLKKVGYAESKRYIATLKSIDVGRELQRIHQWQLKS